MRGQKTEVRFPWIFLASQKTRSELSSSQVTLFYENYHKRIVQRECSTVDCFVALVCERATLGACEII